MVNKRKQNLLKIMFLLLHNKIKVLEEPIKMPQEEKMQKKKKILSI
jgi:hypothetical protein